MATWNKDDPAFRKRRQPRADLLKKNRADYPWVPADYWNFMDEIGYGELGGISFYEGLTAPTRLGLQELPGDMVLFGDDMSGYSYGFSKQTGEAVVGVDSIDWSTEVVANDFAEFMTDLVSK